MRAVRKIHEAGLQFSFGSAQAMGPNSARSGQFQGPRVSVMVEPSGTLPTVFEGTCCPL